MTTAVSSHDQIAKAAIFGEANWHTDGDVLQLAFAGDDTLYSLEDQGVLRRWQPETGAQLHCMALSDLESLWMFSSDARLLASASDDLTIWDTTSGQPIAMIPQPAWVTALAFHPDAHFIATGHDDGAIGFWNTSGHHSVFKKPFIYHKKPISALAISPDGNRLAAASEDRTISLWDLATGRYLGCLAGPARHTDRIPALAWHPSSKFLVSAGWDATARVWDAETMQPVILLNSHAAQVHAVTFSRNGKWLASGDSANTIHLWDFEKKETVHKVKVADPVSEPAFAGPERRARPRPTEPTFRAEIATLAFSYDAKYLACNGDGVIHLWNPETGERLSDRASRPPCKTTVSVDTTGNRLLSNTGGVNAQLWEIATRQSVPLNTNETFHTLAFSPAGNCIAGAIGSHIRVWDASGAVIGDWEDADERITVLAFSPDGKQLASGSRHSIAVRIWRVADGEPILNIQDALDGCSIEALAWLPDGQSLAVGGIDVGANIMGNDGQVSIWSIPERAEITAFLNAVTALAVHPAGTTLAGASLDQTIFIWDLQSESLRRELAGHDSAVHCLAYSPDGNWLVSGGADLALRVWDANGEQVAVVELHSQPTSVTFSADGTCLYVGHANTTCSQFHVHDLLPKN